MRKIQILLALILSLSLLHTPSAFAAPQPGALTHNAILQDPTPTPFPDLQPTPAGPPLSLTIALICFCLIFLAIIGILILGVVVRKQNMEESKKEQP
jgi:hypothetical protein